MNINYDKITNSVIESAIKTNLQVELRKYSLKIAQTEARNWLDKNKKLINDSIEKKIESKMKPELPTIINKTANTITIKPGKKYYSY